MLRLGGGKTFAAIMIALYKKLPVIVIAPKNLCEGTWKKDLIENGVAEEDIFVYNQPSYSAHPIEYEEEFKKWLYK